MKLEDIEILKEKTRNEITKVIEEYALKITELVLYGQTQFQLLKDKQCPYDGEENCFKSMLDIITDESEE